MWDCESSWESVGYSVDIIYLRPDKSPAGKTHTAQFHHFKTSRLSPFVVAGVCSSGQRLHHGPSVVL